MFNAQDAQKIVHAYYQANKEKCQPWVVFHLEDALSKVHECAQRGRTEMYYEVCMEKELYKSIKKKELLYSLMRQNFKVSVSEHPRREAKEGVVKGVIKTYTIYTISWSTPDE